LIYMTTRCRQFDTFPRIIKALAKRWGGNFRLTKALPRMISDDVIRIFERYPNPKTTINLMDALRASLYAARKLGRRRSASNPCHWRTLP